MEKDKFKEIIYVPETFSGDHGYILNMCIDLKFGKMKRKINTLTYSNIFFLNGISTSFQQR